MTVRTSKIVSGTFNFSIILIDCLFLDVLNNDYQSKIFLLCLLKMEICKQLRV